ncbi:hypothetical protein ACHAXH_002551 [Discostella pseudostelligera]
MSESIATEVVSAMVGGIFSASALYPLEVLKTRMQAETKSQAAAATPAASSGTKEDNVEGGEGDDALDDVNDDDDNQDQQEQGEEAASKDDKKMVITTHTSNSSQQLHQYQKLQQAHQAQLLKQRYTTAASQGMTSYAKLMYEQEGGIAPFYSGVLTSAIQSATEKALYFFAYTFYKNGYVGITGSSDFGTLPNLILGCMAEWSHLPITLPIDCLTTAIQTDAQNRGALALLWNILSTKGVGGFYKGIEAYTVLCLKPAIQYTVYEQVKRIVLAARRGKRLASKGDRTHDEDGGSDHSSLHAAEAFFLGMFARIVATMLTYPYLRAKVMLQSNNSNTSDGGKKKTIPQMIAEQLSTGGVSGLYQGIGPELTRGVFSAALMMMVKERIGVVVKTMIDG